MPRGWSSYLVDGRPSLAIKQATDQSSGAYAIRRKDSRGVVYVGESHLGRMWTTLTRHFQAPETFTARKKPGGANAFATDRPEDYEVTWQITRRGKHLKGDAKAMALQARWIAKFRKAGHRLHNRDDGLANAEVERDYAAHRAKQAEEAEARPWYENPAAKGAQPLPVGVLHELGVLTAIVTAKGEELWWGLKNAPVLAYDSKRRLFIVYAGKVVRPSTKAERKEYARTHWGAQGKGEARGGGVAVGPFASLGPSTSITYTTRKGRGVELVDWFHEWGEGGPRKWAPPTLLEHVCRDCGPRCASAGALALRGGSYTVNERGIVG